MCCQVHIHRRGKRNGQFSVEIFDRFDTARRGVTWHSGGISIIEFFDTNAHQ